MVACVIVGINDGLVDGYRLGECDTELVGNFEGVIVGKGESDAKGS